MDWYAKAMITRGPALAGDGGGAHIVGLPGPAARAFASGEPGYQVGVYREVLLRRWRNALGRAMRDFPGGRADGNRYLVPGPGTGPTIGLALPPGWDELIPYGAAAVRQRRRLAGGGGAGPGPGPG